jgi:two-component system, cell cycle response regulator
MIKILVADDDQEIRILIKHHLKDNEYSLYEAVDGEDTLTQLNKVQPDILLLDVEMPKLNGFEVVKQIRNNNKYSRLMLYIIFLTAKTDIDDKVKGLSSGADDYLTKPFHHKELEMRIEIGIRSVKEKHSAYKDSLTKLYNKKFFNLYCEQTIREAERYNSPLSLVIIDIDFFKKVNDTFGHTAGDIILQQLAIILLDSCRDTDIACRWGGEEFVLLMTNTNKEGALVIAERLRQKVESNKFSVVGSLTISLGVAQYIADKDEWFQNADKGLYRAKESGRNKVVVF